tara:strand:- start:42017 stop:42259 length:243 start_codon:yes stop_codon:yes gene_type:complete
MYVYKSTYDVLEFKFTIISRIPIDEFALKDKLHGGSFRSYPYQYYDGEYFNYFAIKLRDAITEFNTTENRNENINNILNE